jgi:polar amino acid transport system substrate-binding protein
MKGIFPMAMLAILAGQALANDKITLHFNERPPYLKPEADGSASGLTATPAGNAFKKSGVPMQWAKTPTNRQLHLLKSNAGKDCAIGWFKNAKREAFAKFTKPLYRDQPLIVLAPSGFNPPANAKLEDLLSDKKTRVLVKDQFSYGPFIDALMAKYNPPKTAAAVESHRMVQMLKAGRADIMFSSPEEADYFIQQSGLAGNEVKKISFPDVPQGDLRYIMCSKQVPDEIIAKLNAHIDDVK